MRTPIGIEDPILAERARLSAQDVSACVEVRHADAGAPGTYAGLDRADILLACGVFGNVSFADARTTICFLPRLLNPSGIVIWTSGWSDDGDDPSDTFRTAGFQELAFKAPANAGSVSA